MKDHSPAGLNQIGPKHWPSEAELLDAARLKQVRGPQSLKLRSKLSTSMRKVKISLAGPKTAGERE